MLIDIEIKYIEYIGNEIKKYLRIHIDKLWT